MWHGNRQIYTTFKPGATWHQRRGRSRRESRREGPHPAPTDCCAPPSWWLQKCRRPVPTLMTLLPKSVCVSMCCILHMCISACVVHLLCVSKHISVPELISPQALTKAINGLGRNLVASLPHPRSTRCAYLCKNSAATSPLRRPNPPTVSFATVPRRSSAASLRARRQWLKARNRPWFPAFSSCTCARHTRTHTRTCKHGKVHAHENLVLFKCACIWLCCV